MKTTEIISLISLGTLLTGVGTFALIHRTLIPVSTAQGHATAVQMQSTSVQSMPTKAAPVRVRPKPPTNVQVQHFSSGDVLLQWSGTLPQGQHWVVYRTTGPAFVKGKRLTSTIQNTFTDRSVKPNTVYYYWVLGENGSGILLSGKPAKVRTYKDWATIHSESEDSVVKIKTYETAFGVLGSSMEGSGWFTENGYIVTNDHVIKNWNWVIDIFTSQGKKYHAKLIATDPTHDLAILKIENGYQESGLPMYVGYKRGERVASLGHPGGQALTLASGTIEKTGITEKVGNYGTLFDMVMTNIPTVDGSSGSPVLNGRGAVVGVIESAGLDNGDLSYFVPVQYVEALIGKATKK